MNNPASCLFVCLQEALQRRRRWKESLRMVPHLPINRPARAFSGRFSSFLMVTESAASLRGPDPPSPPSVDRLLMTFHRQSRKHIQLSCLSLQHTGPGRWESGGPALPWLLCLLLSGERRRDTGSLGLDLTPEPESPGQIRPDVETHGATVCTQSKQTPRS